MDEATLQHEHVWSTPLEARNITRAEWNWVGVVSGIILALTVAPILWGYLIAPDGWKFGGIIYNWQDSYSYLAKIWQGVRGEWVFTNPYSIETGPPIYALYLNYLLLGHLAAWLQLDTTFVFHAARIAGGAILLFTLYAFLARIFSTVADRRFAFLICALGSGLGWLAVLFGKITPDLWQTELSPFLSMHSNPHFPLAIAAFIWVVDLVCIEPTLQVRDTLWMWAGLAASAVTLAITQPYALIVAAGVGVLWLVLGWMAGRRVEWRAAIRLAVVLAVAAPFALYDVWIVVSDPDIALFNAQDLAPTASVPELLLGGGLLLLLAVIGGVIALKRFAGHRDNRIELIAVLWGLVGVLMMYSPSLQQHRFAFALFIPLGVLAVIAIQQVRRLERPAARLAIMAMLSLTNILFLIVLFATLNHGNTNLFVTDAEWKAMQFLRAAVPQHTVVLASPEMGLYIPAWSGQRVVYGHPIETLHNTLRRTQVTAFYTGTLSDTAAFLAPVDVIFMGTRERALGSPQIPASYKQIYVDGDTAIYQRP